MRKRFPSTLPGVVAANFTVKVALCPGESVAGRARPATLKSVLLTMAWLTLMLLVPKFVTVAICELKMPTAALIEKLLGDTDSCGSGSAKPAHPEMQNTISSAKTAIGTNTFISFDAISGSFAVGLKVMFLWLMRYFSLLELTRMTPMLVFK
jgi:hypothetical protein